MDKKESMLAIFQSSPTNFKFMPGDDFVERIVYDQNGKPQANIVDQFPSQKFNRNENGFLKSDIQALMEAQTQQQYDLIRSRLQELGDDFDGRSVDDIIDTVVPRSCQDITEVMAFNNSLGNILMSKHQMERSSSDSQQTIKFADDDNSLSNANPEGV